MQPKPQPQSGPAVQPDDVDPARDAAPAHKPDTATRQAAKQPPATKPQVADDQGQGPNPAQQSPHGQNKQPEQAPKDGQKPQQQGGQKPQQQGGQPAEDKPREASRKGQGGQNQGQGPHKGQKPAGQKPRGQGHGKGPEQATQGGQNAQNQKPPQQHDPKVLPVAKPATRKRRHSGVMLSFLLGVILPTAIAALYLFVWAEDQYASKVGFSVRQEEVSSAMDILGGLSNLSGSSSSDTDILYEYIQSQELVQQIDQEVDLRSLYSKPDNDPVFSFDPDKPIEDLVDYWGRMVRIDYDAATGLIELRVNAFAADDAQRIAQAIFDNSAAMINELSDIARDDSTRYAQEELEVAIERLKQAREAMTSFRSRTQIVDPSAGVQGQMGLLNTLQQQLAEALIEADLLSDTTGTNDPRYTQTQRRIEVIQNRIAAERQKFGIGGAGPSGEDYTTLVTEFERLSVDRQFAEQAYTAALSAYDAAQAEARRRSRYLAAYVRPTLAQKAQYPQRGILTALVGGFLLLAWSIIILTYYSVRDRR